MNKRSKPSGALILQALILMATATMLPGKAEGENAWTQGTNPILVINLLSFDSPLGDIPARLMLKLPKSEITPRFSPKSDYYLVDELTVNESVLKIDSTKDFSVFNNVLPTTYQVDDAGSQFIYPFDVHHAEIRAFVDKSVNGNSVDLMKEHPPVTVDTSLCSFEGYKITLIPGPDNAPNYVNLKIELRRTLAIKVFVVFLSLLMLSVSIGFMMMVRKLMKSEAAPDINELAFGAALLFAFPAIRSIEPSVPPMGVLSDFFGFFWAETIVALSLIAYLHCWMKRKTHD
jgi:hypothetical protein